MDLDAWRAAKRLFQSALERSPEDREAFLLCEVADEFHRAEALRLLRAHHDASPFLESPVAPPTQDALDAPDPMIGRDVGGFRILRRIGMGGMGVVYEAMQEHPRRKAAAKILRPERLSPREHRRFEFESEVLARLQHPGIARVYASGHFELDRGTQRWFAMELIEGPTLLELLRTSPLPIPQLVALLIALCDAVHHAHTQGVIHRDLKPDNIRMARADDSHHPHRPVILDFGVARLVDADASAVAHTTTGEILGTLDYMSPEQLSGDPRRIDARTDVYSLGVIGYELLCGRLPHASRATTVAETIRTIAEVDPPSAGSIDPELRGDLEVILAKALEKNPERRYQSAVELAADLRRHLLDEPIAARPATILYRARKFTRRNRALVGGVSATTLALLGGLALSLQAAHTASMEAANARYEADKAAAINNFITNDFLMKLLAAANTDDGSARLPVADLIRTAAASIDTMFAAVPAHEAAVRNEVATIYYNLGDADAAAEQFARALELWEAALGPDHADTLKAVNNLGQARARQQRPAEAEALYRRALDGRRRTLGEEDPYTLITMNNLADCCRATGRLDEAEDLLRRALDAQRRIHGPSHKNTITSLGNLATLLMQRDRPEEAIAMHREAHEASRATLGADHVMTAMTGTRLAIALQKSGHADEAEPILIAAVASFDRTLGAASPDAVSARRALARVYRKLGNSERAAEQLTLALDAVRAAPTLDAELERKLEAELNALR